MIDINLSKVTYLEGLGIFIAFYKQATREKVALKLAGLTNRFMRQKVGTWNECI